MHKTIPELRFPEFSREWQKTRLGNIGIFVGGGTPPTKNTKFWNGDIPWLSSSDIGEESIREVHPYRYITTEAIENSATKLIPEGAILVVSRVGVGKVALAPFDLCTSQDFTNIVIDGKTFDNRWMAYRIKNATKELMQFNQGTSIKGFTTKDLKNTIISIPSLPEQQKIADFLTAIDEKITLISEKIEALERYKKGMMQKLLSGELRFPGFGGEWREVKLGEIGKFKSGTGFPEAEQGGQTGIPFYKVSDMNIIGNEIEMMTANNYVSGIQIKQLKLKPITEKAIIFAKVGAAIFLERKRIAKNFLLDNNMMAFIPDESNHFLFIKYVLDSSRLSKYAQVGALPSYNASDLGIIKAYLPSKDEQQKIADFLTAIDDKLTLEKERLDQLKTYKQGLLQKMFV